MYTLIAFHVKTFKHLPFQAKPGPFFLSVPITVGVKQFGALLE